MTLLRSIVIGLFCVAGLNACASASDGAAAGSGGFSGASGFGGASGDGGSVAAAGLVLESPASMTLASAAQAEIVVRYVNGHGAPIADASVSFTLVGGAQDSGLSRVLTTTDGAGHATTRVIAGAQAASFQVRVSAADAVPLVIDVAVSDRGFGNLRVTAAYSGARPVTRRRVTLFAAETCATVDQATGPDRQSNLASGSEEARFIGLPAESRYAVVAEAFAMDEVTLARGCIDDVVIAADSDVTASVTLHDVDLIPWGDYELGVSLGTTGVAAELADCVRAQPVSSVPTMEATAAQLLLIALDETLRTDPLALAQVAAADELVTLRASTTADADLQAALDVQMQGPALAQAWLADQLALQLATVDLELGFRVSEGMPDPTVAWTLQRATVDSTLTSTGVIEHLLIQPEASMATPTFVWSRDQMTATGRIPAVFGALAVEVLDAVIDDQAATGRAQVRELLGCQALGSWVESRLGIASACDEACVTSACDLLLSTILSRLHAGLTKVDETRAVVSLGATFDLYDTIGDANVDAFDSSMVMATWEADPAVVSGTGSYMTGTATAVRLGIAAQ